VGCQLRGVGLNALSRVDVVVVKTYVRRTEADVGTAINLPCHTLLIHFSVH